MLLFAIEVVLSIVFAGLVIFVCEKLLFCSHMSHCIFSSEHGARKNFLMCSGAYLDSLLFDPTLGIWDA